MVSDLKASGNKWWWRAREAALLAVGEVQEVLSDVAGGESFRVTALLDLVLSQAIALNNWLIFACHRYNPVILFSA